MYTSKSSKPDDIQELLTSNALFARKLRENESENLIRQMVKHISNI